MSRDLSMWEDVVSRVAASVAPDYPEVDEEPLRFYLNTIILTFPEQFTDPFDPGVTEALIYIADRYAVDKRTYALSVSVQYNYRKSDVCQILDTIYADKTQWLDGWVPADAKSIKASVDSLDLHCDVSWALGQLHSVDQYRLADHFRCEQELFPDEVDQALRRLLDKLNNYRGRKWPST